MKDDHCGYIRNFCGCEKKAWAKFRLVRDLNPWPLQYWCSALPIKLTSQLEAVIELKNWFVINPWKDDDEVMNICKSYMWTAEWRIKWRMIIAVIYATFAVAKRMPYQPYPVQARIFFRLSFCNCKSCIYNTNDHPSFNSSLCSSHIWFSYIRNFMITIVDHQNCYYKVGTDLDVWGYFLLKFSFIFS